MTHKKNAKTANEFFKLAVRFPGSGGRAELLGTEIGGFWVFRHLSYKCMLIVWHKLAVRFPGSGGRAELLGTEIGGFWVFRHLSYKCMLMVWRYFV
jgi:hypothetical protein